MLLCPGRRCSPDLLVLVLVLVLKPWGRPPTHQLLLRPRWRWSTQLLLLLLLQPWRRRAGWTLLLRPRRRLLLLLLQPGRRGPGMHPRLWALYSVYQPLRGADLH